MRKYKCDACGRELKNIEDFSYFKQIEMIYKTNIVDGKICYEEGKINEGDWHLDEEGSEGYFCSYCGNYLHIGDKKFKNIIKNNLTI